MRTTIFLSVIDRALAVCVLIACVLVLRAILKKAPRRMLLLLWLPVALRLLSPMTVQSRFSLLPVSLSQSLSAYFQAEETTYETPQTDNPQTGTQPGMNLSDNFQTNIGQSGIQADTDVSGKAQNTADPNKVKPADGQTDTNPSGSIQTPANTDKRNPSGTQAGTNPSDAVQNPSDPSYAASDSKDFDSGLPEQITSPDTAKLPENGGLLAASKKILFLKTASIVWLAGILLLAAYVLFELLRLRRLTKNARVQEIDGIPVYFGEHIPAPFLCGLFTPRIYLPDGLDAKYLTSVLAHERMHKNGGDNLLKPLAFLITVIYWFHPLVWLSYILFCKDLELACDERVISNLDTEGRKEYSLTLLAISTMPRTVYGYPIAFGETDIAGRIRHICSFRKPKKVFTVLCVLFCAALTACFSTNSKGSGEPTASDKGTPTPALRPTDTPTPALKPTDAPTPVLKPTEELTPTPEPEGERIPIDETHFTSAVFRKFIAERYDTDADGFLSWVERRAVTEIEIGPMESLEESSAFQGETIDGLENFPALKSLSVNSCSVGRVCIENHPVLEYFGGEMCGFGDILIKSCPAFRRVGFHRGDFRSLTVSEVPRGAELSLMYTEPRGEISLDANMSVVLGDAFEVLNDGTVLCLYNRSFSEETQENIYEKKPMIFTNQIAQELSFSLERCRMAVENMQFLAGTSYKNYYQEPVPKKTVDEQHSYDFDIYDFEIEQSPTENEWNVWLTFPQEQNGGQFLTVKKHFSVKSETKPDKSQFYFIFSDIKSFEVTRYSPNCGILCMVKGDLDIMYRSENGTQKVEELKGRSKTVSLEMLP